MMTSSENRHIAIVTQDMYRQGGQYVTSLIAKGLAGRGYRVDLLVSRVHQEIGRGRPDLRPFAVPENVRMISLPESRASRNIGALARYLREEKPAIVMPMAGHYLMATAMARMIAGKRARLIYVEHNMHGAKVQADLSKQPVLKRVQASIGRSLFHVLARRADRVIAVSRGVAQLLRDVSGIAPERLITIYNPVIDDAFLKKKAQGPDHPWLKNKDKPVVVAAGALHADKDFASLLRAAALLKDALDFRLIIFGDGKEREALEALIDSLGLRGRVSLPGHTDNLPGNLSAADLFVLSSRGETFSIVIVEALACGVPVVATDCPVGPREVLQDGKYGVLVPPNDSEALARAIQTSISARRQVPAESLSPYLLDSVIDRYEDVFQNVLSR